MENDIEKKYVAIPQETHPPLEIDFESLLAELRGLENESSFSDEEIMNMLVEINKRFRKDASGQYQTKEETREYVNEKESDFFVVTLARIKKECGHAENFDAFLNSLEIIESTEINSEHEDTRAEYDHLTGKINIDREKVGIYALEILENLARFGFSLPIYIIHHEAIHKGQFDLPAVEQKKERRRSLLTSIFSNIPIDILRRILVGSVALKNRQAHILKEAHAYFGGNRYIAATRSDKRNFLSTNFLYDILKDYKIDGVLLMNNKYEVDNLIAAGTAVKRLHALGLKDEEIGQLVKKAKWKYIRGEYDPLEKKVKEIMTQKDLEEEDVDNLVLADDIKRKIYVNKVRLIAQEELKKAFDNIPRQSA